MTFVIMVKIQYVPCDAQFLHIQFLNFIHIQSWYNQNQNLNDRYDTTKANRKEDQKTT